MSPVSDTGSTGGTARPLAEVVDQLCAGAQTNHKPAVANGHKTALPSRDAIIGAMEQLRSVIFPGYFGISEVSAESIRFHVGATLDRVGQVLAEQILRGLCFDCSGGTPEQCAQCERDAADKTRRFLACLPEIQRLLKTDAEAAYEGDPAAMSLDETIFCYPGIQAIISQRLAHELYRLEVPLIPRIITEHAHSITGIDIHPGAQIGEKFFIDHGTGVVIGETCEIGDRVRIYQGVTLGAKSFPLDDDGNPIKGVPRHPLVQDDVIIYSGATILGRVTIGAGSVVGGNVWLTKDVPPGSRITQVQARPDRYVDGGGI